jgi:hypothetical protein
MSKRILHVFSIVAHYADLRKVTQTGLSSRTRARSGEDFIRALKMAASHSEADVCRATISTAGGHVSMSANGISSPGEKCAHQDVSCRRTADFARVSTRRGGRRAAALACCDGVVRRGPIEARLARINELAISLRDGVGTGSHVSGLRMLVENIVEAST